jgi:hypothetical protein
MFVVAVALAAASACSNQGQGERCDKNNNDADCSAGLVCTSASLLAPGLPVGSAICCPVAGQPVTVDACRSQSSFNTGGGTDAGPEAAAPDATTDSGARKSDAGKHDGG